jgi:hypothetical protein
LLQSLLRGEAITDAADRVNVSRILGIVFEFLAKPGNVDIDGARRDSRLVFPDGFQEFVAGDYCAAAIDLIA